MRISELAERTDVPASTLRYYEDIGLLTTRRTSAGYRDYDEEAVRRLASIGAAKRLGFTLDDIAGLLALRADSACAEVKTELAQRISDGQERAEEWVAELTELIAVLRAARDGLHALPDRAEPCDCACDDLLAPEPIPIACSLGPADLYERAERWQEMTAGAARTPIPGGIRLQVPADRAAALAELAVAEQRCCPFLDIRLRPSGTVIELDVRAPEGGAELIGYLLGPQ